MTGVIVLLATLGASWAAGEAVGRWLAPGTERTLVPHVLSLTVLRNRGVAFGLLASLPPEVVAAVALTVLGVALYNKSAWSATGAGQWGLGLLAGGALANVLERLRFGYVVDYLDVHIWPVFNLADAAIVVGACLAVLALPRPGRSGGG